MAPDGRVTFRIHAPNAKAVRLSAGDIVGLVPAASAMTRGDDGIWAITVSAPEAGSYRYNFNVDGVATIDPRNPATSESFQNTWSVAHVPGSKPWDVTDVPHGAVAAVTYRSASLGQFRRMHVYTPPGYETGTASYPVFYLLHGAGDSDDSWTSVGRANFVFDSLIAGKKAVPMIVVMTAGHVRGIAGMGGEATQAFVNDLVRDVKPYIESHYRVRKGRANTAIAGLSMGGHQTLNAAALQARDAGGLVEPLAFHRFSTFTGGAGFFGSATGVCSFFITSATARSSCGSLPAMTDFGSFSTSMSGSTP